jgi:molecular chaperone GrpE
MWPPNPHIFASQQQRISTVTQDHENEPETDQDAQQPQAEDLGGAEGAASMPPENESAVSNRSDSEPASDDIEALRQALQEARGELDRHREALLRMQAETDNQRKRMEREQEKSRRFALERVMKDLLQVRDSLERGLEVDEDTATVEKLREGKALTLKVLSKVMADHGLELIDPQGEPFNPEFHQAMSMAPSEEYEPNTVVEVLQKGFRLHDRLIRPAMVVVSQKPA